MKQKFAITARIVILLAMLATVLGMAARPAEAAIEIPYGATVTSATLILDNYWTYGDGKTVYIHSVTAPWTETTVTWNSFNNAFDPAVIGSFSVPSNYGFISNVAQINVTTLVQAWISGKANNGLLLESPVQDTLNIAKISSREGLTPPVLKICYQISESVTCVTEISNADTFVWQYTPDVNYGTSTELIVGKVEGNTKYILLQFDILSQPPSGPGTGTPGYWKIHPNDWPVETITIGNQTYSKAQAIAYMMMDDRQDKTITMFRGLVSAKLNVLVDNPSSCIDSFIVAADDWMINYGPVTKGVQAYSDAWKVGEPIYRMLDSYNNGLLCAVHRN